MGVPNLSSVLGTLPAAPIPESEAAKRSELGPEDAQCDAAIFWGDVQARTEAHFEGPHSSVELNYWAPTVRGPALSAAALHTTDEILYQAYRQIDPDCHFVGGVNMGDNADLGTVEEITTVTDVMKNEAKPWYKVLLSMVSNHDMAHLGTLQSENDLFGLAGISLDLQGKDNKYDGIYRRQAGGNDRVLDKKRLIDILYGTMLNREPNHAYVAADNEFRYVLRGKSDENRWTDLPKVFSDFWREDDDGLFHATVSHVPEDKSGRMEREWLHLQATKMHHFQTSHGDIPVYFIALDTMDFIDSPAKNGLTSGYMSKAQCRMIQAFIAQMKQRDPDAKFFLSGHFGLNTLHAPELFNRILNDESVLGYIGAHDHDRAYHEAVSNPVYRKKFHLTRKAPLAFLTVPASVDWPHEVLSYQARWNPRNPDQLSFEFKFSGINPKEIRGNHARVDKAVSGMESKVLILDDIIVDLLDEREQIIAMPNLADKKSGENERRKLKAFDELLDEAESLPSLLAQNSIMIGQFWKARLYSQIATEIIQLNLWELGLEQEPTGAPGTKEELGEIQRLYGEISDYLLQLFRIPMAAHLTFKRMQELEAEGRMGSWDYHQLDKQISDLYLQYDNLLENPPESWKKLSKATEKVLEKVQAAQKTERDPGKILLLSATYEMLNDLRGYTWEYRHWMIGYGNRLRTHQTGSPWENDADLFSFPSFRKLIVKDIWQKLPRGSNAHAFLVRTHLMGAEQENKFYGELRQHRVERFVSSLRQIGTVFNLTTPESRVEAYQVPDRIKLDYSIRRGKVTHLTPPSKLMTPKEYEQWRKEKWSNPHVSDDYRRLEARLRQPPENKPNHRLSLELTSEWGSASNPQSGSAFYWAPGFGVGQRHRLINHPNIARLYLDWQATGRFQFEYRDPSDALSFNLGAKTSITTGDPMGWVEAGLHGEGGISARNLRRDDPVLWAPYVGGGLTIKGAEWLSLDIGAREYFQDGENSVDKYVRANADIIGFLEFLRIFNLGPKE